MPVIHPEQAPTFDAGGATITGLAAPSRGATDTAAWRVRFSDGHASPPHSLDREEVFVVLSGAVTARYADHSETAHAGGALIVPAGVEFSVGGPAARRKRCARSPSAARRCSPATAASRPGRSRRRTRARRR